MNLEVWFCHVRGNLFLSSSIDYVRVAPWHTTATVCAWHRDWPRRDLREFPAIPLSPMYTTVPFRFAHVTEQIKPKKNNIGNFQSESISSALEARFVEISTNTLRGLL